MSNRKPPIRPQDLILTQGEYAILQSLTHHEQSAFGFWQALLTAKGIHIPANRVLRISPKPQFPGTFLLAFEPKALGPKAIREGAEWRAYMERRDAQFALSGRKIYNPLTGRMVV